MVKIKINRQSGDQAYKIPINSEKSLQNDGTIIKNGLKLAEISTKTKTAINYLILCT
jgi:hypothetical protein